jgi:caa(3)-type oxidase subunit IV
MTPVATRIAAYLATLLLLGLNIGLSYLPISGYRVAAHLAIAVITALLIFLVFMRLRSSPHLAQAIASATILWVLILFGITFLDYTHR